MTDNRVVLVTGANKGIGYEAVKLLAQKLPSGKIILTTRTLKNGTDAVQKMKESSDFTFYNVKILQLEITDSASLKKAVETVKSDYGRLDVLIHNSAVSSVDGESYAPGILDTNVRGAHDTVEAFLPLIPQHGLVVVVSSEVGSWTTHAVNDSLRARLDDPSQITWSKIEALSDDWVAYAQGKQHKEQWPELSAMNGGYTISKALLSAWLRAFAIQQGDRVKVAIVCPGYCATDLNNNSGFRTAKQGAESITWPLFNTFKSGQFYQDGHEHAFVAPMPEEYIKAFTK